MDTDSIIGFIILFLLLSLSAFFSSAETALTTVNKIRICALIEEGNKKAETVQRILDSYSKMLSTILVGNNIVNISASSLATTLAIDIWGSYAVGFMTGALTLAVLLFGDITPKTWAMYHSEKISLTYAKIIYFLMQLFTPIIFVIDKLSGAILTVFRINTSGKTTIVTEKDVKTYVDVGHEDGAIEKEEKEMIYNVFDFSDSDAKDVMIPKIDIVMVDINATYNELMKIFKESMYTRIPVYENDTDNVVGIVNVKDLILVPNKKVFSIRDILRDTYYTYEYKKTADLMVEMRKAAMNMAIVLNEYGACAGMVTLEDLLEEIVGEIRDEYDGDEETLIQEIDTRTYLVEGSMKLDDINDALHTTLFSEDYDSIGGILIEALDHLPEKGETITTADGILLRAEEINQNRIEKVFMVLPDPAKEQCCYDLLDSLDIPYEQMHHAPAATIEDCEEIDAALHTKICKNLFLCNRQQTDFYLILMPGEKKFLTKNLSAQLGVARLSFASPEKMEELLHLTPGSVTILGLMHDAENKVQLVIDKEILEQESFACHPCTNTASVKIKTSDLTEKLIPALNHEPVYVEL